MNAREEREKKINQLWKDSEIALSECEVVPNRDPYFVKYEILQERTTPLDNAAVIVKIGQCRNAVELAQKAVDEAQEKKYLSIERCNILKEKTNNFTKKYREIGDFWSDLEGVGLGFLGISHTYNDLRNRCNEIIEFNNQVKEKICPTALSNALWLHYLLNERTNQIDITSGLINRDLEKLCYDFPLTHEIPYYSKDGKLLLTLEIKVSKDPDPTGRVGEVSVLMPITDDPEKIEYVWNTLTNKAKLDFLSKHTKRKPAMWVGMNLRWDNLSDTEQRLILDELDVSELKKEMKMIKVGSETCVWAGKEMTFWEQEQEAEEVERKTKEARDLTEALEIYKDQWETFERLESGIIDASPRRFLFDATVSTFEAWAELDFKPVDEYGLPIIDLALANMLYFHIGKIEPKLLANHFIKLIEGEANKGVEHWKWAYAWLEKFHEIKDYLSLADLEYLHKIMKVPMTEILPKAIIMNKIKAESGMNTQTRVKKYFELNDLEDVMDKVLNLLQAEGEFYELWQTFFPTMRSWLMRSALDTNALETMQKRMNWVLYELDITKKGHKARDIYEKWAMEFIEARKGRDISMITTLRPETRYRAMEAGRDVGLFKNVSTVETVMGMYVTVTDHRNHKFDAIKLDNAFESLCDIEKYYDEWWLLTSEDQMDWLIRHSNYTQAEFEDMYDEELTAALREAADNYVYWKCPCWNDDTQGWDEEKVLQTIYDKFYDQIDWKFRQTVQLS